MAKSPDAGQLSTAAVKELVDASFRECCALLAETNDEQLIFDFFTCICTPAERNDIGKRWLLVKELDRGTPQRDIASRFGMSLCKITRGSRELNKPNSAFQKMLERLVTLQRDR
ncbi:MAG: transcriptional regulator [Treponema sp.]|nr:transcriptional regulator [Treponema sp.]